MNLDAEVEEGEEVELFAQVGLPAEGLVATCFEVPVQLGRVVAGLVFGQTGSVVARNNLISWYPQSIGMII